MGAKFAVKKSNAKVSLGTLSLFKHSTFGKMRTDASLIGTLLVVSTHNSVTTIDFGGEILYNYFNVGRHRLVCGPIAHSARAHP